MVLSGPDFAGTISQHPLAGASHPDSGIAFGEQKVRLTRWGAVALIDSFLSAIHLSAQSKMSGRRDNDNSSLVQRTNLQDQIAASNKREEYAWESI